MSTRMKDMYRSEVVPALMKQFSYANVMAVPRLSKITVNMGVGDAISDIKLLDQAVDELGAIVGQKAVVTRAKKSIANFKLRKGMPIGCMVTGACGTSLKRARPILRHFSAFEPR